MRDCNKRSKGAGMGLFHVRNLLSCSPFPWDKVSLCSSFLGNSYVEFEAGLKLTEILLPCLLSAGTTGVQNYAWPKGCFLSEESPQLQNFVVKGRGIRVCLDLNIGWSSYFSSSSRFLCIVLWYSDRIWRVLGTASVHSKHWISSAESSYQLVLLLLPGSQAPLQKPLQTPHFMNILVSLLETASLSWQKAT